MNISFALYITFATCHTSYDINRLGGNYTSNGGDVPFLTHNHPYTGRGRRFSPSTKKTHTHNFPTILGN